MQSGHQHTIGMHMYSVNTQECRSGEVDRQNHGKLMPYIRIRTRTHSQTKTRDLI